MSALIAIKHPCKRSNYSGCTEYGFAVRVKLSDNDIKNILRLFVLQKGEVILSISKSTCRPRSCVINLATDKKICIKQRCGTLRVSTGFTSKNNTMSGGRFFEIGRKGDSWVIIVKGEWLV